MDAADCFCCRLIWLCLLIWWFVFVFLVGGFMFSCWFVDMFVVVACCPNVFTDLLLVWELWVLWFYWFNSVADEFVCCCGFILCSYGWLVVIVYLLIWVCCLLFGCWLCWCLRLLLIVFWFIALFTFGLVIWVVFAWLLVFCFVLGACFVYIVLFGMLSWCLLACC